MLQASAQVSEHRGGTEGGSVVRAKVLSSHGLHAERAPKDTRDFECFPGLILRMKNGT